MSNLKEAIELLKLKREKISREAQKQIDGLTAAITALIELGEVPELEPKTPRRTKFPPRRRTKFSDPLKRKTMVVRTKEPGAIILKQLGMTYRDVAIDLIKKKGKPVRASEVTEHLSKLSGRNLDPKRFNPLIGVTLKYAAKHGRNLVELHDGYKTLYDLTPEARAANKSEIISADVRAS